MDKNRNEFEKDCDWTEKSEDIANHFVDSSVTRAKAFERQKPFNKSKVLPFKEED